jgi:hypothetical protein
MPLLLHGTSCQEQSRLEVGKTNKTEKNHLQQSRRHVFHDLKAYVCTFENCNLFMFKSRREWFAHELAAHRCEWQCQFCESDAFSSKKSFLEHTESRHAKILTYHSLDALLLQSVEPVDKIGAEACQLCDDWEAELTKHDREPLVSLLSNNETVSTVRRFRRHLGRHMEQLALFALPVAEYTPSDDEDDDSSKDGSQAGPVGTFAPQASPAIISDMPVRC